PDQAPAQGIAGDSIVRPGAADLEAAQVVAAQEETVDDLLLLALVPQVTPTGGQREPPVAVAGEPIQRNEILAVDIAANEVGIAAQTGGVSADRDQITSVRIDLAVATVERHRLTDL